MSTQNWPTIVASLAILAAFWRQSITLINRLRSVFLVRVTVTGHMARALNHYCLRTFRRSPIGDRLYASETAFVRPLSRMQEVAWEKPPKQPLILFSGWKPLLLGGHSYSAPGVADSPVTDDGVVTVTAPRWLFNLETLLIAALDDYNERQNRTTHGIARYCVQRIGGNRRSDNRNAGYVGSSPAPQPAVSNNVNPWERFLKWQPGDIGPARSDNPLDAIALAPEVKPVVEEFMQWKMSEDWFRKHKVPWRRGWLLHGGPGTGKTSLVRALAQHADMPIFAFDLSSLANDELVYQWRNMQENVPCIALIEDIDAVFHGRENIAGDKGGGLSFDCLLNCLSGIESADGVFLIITTNDTSKLDPALGLPGEGVSTRPGRLDRTIEMPSLPFDCLKQIATRILGDWPDEVEAILAKAADLTGAQITELCVQRALQIYWRAQQPAVKAPDRAPDRAIAQA